MLRARQGRCLVFLASIAPAAVACKPTLAAGQIDCDTEVQYQARRVEANVDVGKFGAHVDTGVNAVRQIDQEVERYLARWKALCAEYNGGVYTKEQYRTQTAEMRARMEELDRILIQLTSAPNAQAYEAALKQLYVAAVPDEQRVELDLDFTVSAQAPSESSSRPVTDGQSLRSGTRVFFTVKPTKTAHVYLYQESANGELNVLFPDGRLKLDNPVAGGAAVRIPPAGVGVFTLNDKDIGTERVFIVASLDAIPDLGSALGKQGTTVAEVNCAARAFKFTADAACDERRGLELDLGGTATAGQEVSMRVTSAAGESKIMQVFQFRHTK